MHTSIRRIFSAPPFRVISMRLGKVDEIGVQHNALRLLAVLLHQLHTNHGTYINIAERADEIYLSSILKTVVHSVFFLAWFIAKCSIYLFTFHATLLCVDWDDESYRPKWTPKWVFLSKIDQSHKPAIALMEQAIVLSVWALWFWCSKYLLCSTMCCSLHCSFVLLVLTCESILIWGGGTEK